MIEFLGIIHAKSSEIGLLIRRSKVQVLEEAQVNKGFPDGSPFLFLSIGNQTAYLLFFRAQLDFVPPMLTPKF